MNIELHDRSDEVLAALQEAAERALEKCGLVAEGYAKRLAEPAVYIGTDSEYAAYVELGTGEHYPDGRPTPWKYQDANGNWHWTKGNPARPYLKPAVADNDQTYRTIIEDELHGR